MIIRIRPFGLVFGNITDLDNQGNVAGASIIDRVNQANFSLIITKVNSFSPNFSNSADDSPDRPGSGCLSHMKDQTCDKTKHLTEYKSNTIFAVSVPAQPTTHHPD